MPAISGLMLESIPGTLLHLLRHLTKHPKVDSIPPSQEAYDSLEPELRLYLSKNLLTTVPGEIFDLQNLKVLSLRHNKLKEVPEAIRKLAHLEELNIAGNDLQTVPWEILELVKTGKLRRLTVHPNPFIGFNHANVAGRVFEDSGKDHPLMKLWNPARHLTPPEPSQPVHIADGPVTFFNIDGGPTRLPSKLRDSSLLTDCTSLAAPDRDASRAPSLLEISLQGCSRSPQLQQVKTILNEEGAENGSRLLKLAEEINDAGGRRCSVCSRDYILARTEWVEWWDCVPHENGLTRPRDRKKKLKPMPFLRRGCSWKCVPRIVKEATRYTLTENEATGK